MGTYYITVTSITKAGRITLNKTIGILAKRQSLGTLDYHIDMTHETKDRLPELIKRFELRNIDKELMTKEEADYCAKEMRNHGLQDIRIHDIRNSEWIHREDRREPTQTERELVAANAD